MSKLAIGRSGTFLDSLMSSSVDVDKIDYVSRDGYFCGLPYGRVDLSSLVESIDLATNKLEKTVVVFDRRGRDALEGLLMSRFYLATTIHVDERNCGANMLLFDALANAYEHVLKPAMKERSDDEIRRLILDCLHFRWVDHDLIMFLEDPFQKLRIAAIEALREGFSSLKPDAIENIIKLMSEQPVKRRTRYLSNVLLKKVSARARADLILMLHHSMYREREFFEGDTRFQALFSVVFGELLHDPCRNYRELIKLPKHFGDLRENSNYETFRDEGYPEFYSVKFAQDLEMLSEMGLLYSRSGPVQIGNTEQFAKRFERRISHYGRTYVERYLLRRYPFSNSLRKKVRKIMASSSPLVKLGL